jgi:cobalt-zinc-cadmium efflux system protein
MSHTYEHSHAPANFNAAFAVGVGLNVAFVLTEVVFGLSSHSLALLSDAGHNLSDVFGLLLAWGAFYLVKKRPTQRHTYGLRRTSILAALLNAAILLVVTGGVAWEAISRFAHPEAVNGSVVVWVALAGVAINAGTALMFMRGREHDVNIKGAFTHMAADALVALGVVAAGIAITYTGWTWLDPAVSLAISLVIVLGTWGLLKESVNLALDAVPEGIDPDAVGAYLAGLPGVTGVHDLHIWGMSTTESALTVHLVKPDTENCDGLLHQTYEELHGQFGIEHATIQVERGQGGHSCRFAPEEAV